MISYCQRTRDLNDKSMIMSKLGTQDRNGSTNYHVLNALDKGSLAAALASDAKSPSCFILADQAQSVFRRRCRSRRADREKEVHVYEVGLV